MNEDELTEAVLSARDVLKVETRDAYDDAGDDGHLQAYARGELKPDPSTKAPWLDLLRSAADRGHPWKWLRVVTRPVPEYVRYACEFGYVDNVEVGKVDLRVLDEVDFSFEVELFKRYGDLYVLDGQVIAMQFERGKFVAAHPEGEVLHSHPWGAHGVKQRVDEAWSRAVPFTRWWAANQDLHRNLTPR